MLKFQKPIECPELADKCRTLLRNLEYKKVTEDMFLKEVALLAIQDKYGFDKIKYKPMPTVPEDLKKYRKLSYAEKRKFLTGNRKFFMEGRVAQYLDQATKVKNENISNEKWLETLKKHLMNTKINERLADFKNARDYVPPMYSDREKRAYLRDNSEEW